MTKKDKTETDIPLNELPALFSQSVTHVKSFSREFVDAMANYDQDAPIKPREPTKIPSLWEIFLDEFSLR